MSLPGADISALEYVFPSHHHKDEIWSLLIGLQKEEENFCVGPIGGKWVKNKAHTSFLPHSTSQLAVCPPCTQSFLLPGDQHAAWWHFLLITSCWELSCPGDHPSLAALSSKMPLSISAQVQVYRQRKTRPACSHLGFPLQTGFSLDMGQWFPSFCDPSDELPLL